MVLFQQSRNYFRYVPENEIEGDILGWTTSICVPFFHGCVVSPFLSIDQTIRFKGRYMDKMRISYKKEGRGGGGFQADALRFFLKGIKLCPKEYAPMGLSPSHARLFSVFPTPCNKFHKVRLRWDHELV